jgi:antirestriction protein ArdC
MAENTTNKDRLKEITASIEDGIKDLFQSDKYMQYLRTMSRFHKYSVNNTMLIFMQRPDATLVAGFNKWKDQFERSVKKGEKGIKIIAPTPFKKKVEEAKLDPDTKAPVLDADGNAVMEEKTVQIPMYKVVSVFDVSQTDGKPLPTLAADLSGNVQNYEIFMEALKRSSPVPIDLKPIGQDMDGFFNSDSQSITIREGMSEVQTVCATVHEIAHSKLHNKNLPEEKEQWKLVMVSDGGTKKDFTGGYDFRAEAEAAADASDWQYTDENLFVWRLEVEEDTSIAEFIQKNRNTEEVEAESISYAVCAYYGIQTNENSFGYIATWSKGKELSELRASMETINKTASGLITDIDRNYAAICRERGLDKAAPEQTTQEQPLPQKAPEKATDLSDEAYFEYKLHANPRSTGEKDAAFIQAYEHKGGELYPADIIGFGAYDSLRPLVNKLNAEKATPEDAKAVFLADAHEALYLIADKEYLHIQLSDAGTWDYSLFDKNTLKLSDGGFIDEPDMMLEQVKDSVMKEYVIGADEMAQIAPDKMREILDAFNAEAEKRVLGTIQPEEAPLGGGKIVDVKVESYDPSEPLPDFPADYPMPDPAVTIADRNAYGYTENDMLPITHAKAAEFFEKDETIYMLDPGNSAGMAFDMDDIDHHNGLFGIRREDWEQEREYLELTAGHELSDKELENNFLNNPADAFAIYQLKHTEDVRDLRFEPLERVMAAGLTVERGNYDLIYTGALHDTGDTIDKLNELYQNFNINHPEDFKGHSLSVSDIVALKQGDSVSCHYVDSFGFKEMPTF